MFKLNLWRPRWERNSSQQRKTKYRERVNIERVWDFAQALLFTPFIFSFSLSHFSLLFLVCVLCCCFCCHCYCYSLPFSSVVHSFFSFAFDEIMMSNTRSFFFSSVDGVFKHSGAVASVYYILCISCGYSNGVKCLAIWLTDWYILVPCDFFFFLKISFFISLKKRSWVCESFAYAYCVDMNWINAQLSHFKLSIFFVSRIWVSKKERKKKKERMRLKRW